MLDYHFTIDIEPTNRCNADCYFCPRDATPHEGLMSQDTFDQALARVLEFRDGLRALDDGEGIPLRFRGLLGRMCLDDVQVALCGLGEPLLNPRTAGFVRQLRDAELPCTLSSNGALLDDRRGGALLDAGVTEIMINIGDLGDEYESVYGLPFEQTRDRIVAFRDRAAGQCEVGIVLVDHRGDPVALAEKRAYWQARGFEKFMEFDLMNRGGALFVDEMQYATFPEHAEARDWWHGLEQPGYCILPLAGANVGYDGNYYLCCSDWRKQAPVGHVRDTSILDTFAPKLGCLASREPVCRTCNHDPVNRMTEQLRAITDGRDEGDRRAMLEEELTSVSAAFLGVVDQLGVTRPDPPQRGRRRIPVRAE